MTEIDRTIAPALPTVPAARGIDRTGGMEKQLEVLLYGQASGMARY